MRGSRAFRLASAGLVVAVNAVMVAGSSGTSLAGVPARHHNQVQNGNFESPVVPGSFTHYDAGSTFTGWTVGSGSIDQTRSYMQPASGSQAIDLNGTEAGTVYQDLILRPGATYNVVFAFAGNPSCGPVFKHMLVRFGGGVLAAVTFNSAGHSTSNMGWILKHYQVQAPGEIVRIEFDSLTSGECGPAIDGVIVIQT